MAESTGTDTIRDSVHVHEWAWRASSSRYGAPPDLIELDCGGCGGFAWYRLESQSKEPTEDEPDRAAMANQEDA